MFVRNAAVIVEAAAVCALVCGCGGGDSSPPRPDPNVLAVPSTVEVFNANAGPWMPNNGRWYSYAQSKEECASSIGFPDGPLSPASCFTWLTGILGAQGQWISSQGPWWVDPNHAQLPGGTGFGLIHVLAFVQLPAALQAPVNLDGTTLRLRTRISADWTRPVAPSREGEKPARAYLWFQTAPSPITNCTPDASIGENCTRQSDYIYTDGWRDSAALDQSAAEQGQAFEIPLRAADATKWTCLGAGANVKYDCMPFGDAIKQVSVMGAILAPVLPCPLPGPAGPGVTCDMEALNKSLRSYFNPGRFELRDFAIAIDSPFGTHALLTTLGSGSAIQPADSWSPIRYAAHPGLKAGGGVHYVIPSGSGALRIGLSTAGTATSFEKAGPHLYISPAGNEPGQPEPMLYVGVADAQGNITQTRPVGYYQEGDRVSIYVWRDQLVFTRNGEVLNMTSSPCSPSDSDCPLLPFMSSLGDSPATPPIYLQ